VADRLRERGDAATPTLAISLLRHALPPAHFDNWTVGDFSHMTARILGRTALREPPGL
jgi:hypothetical protein